MDTMAERISWLVSRAGETQSDLGVALGLSRGYISHLCKGVREPSDRTVQDICRYYKVSEVWLRTGVGEPFEQPSRREELAALVGDLLADSPNSTRARLITVLLRYDPNGPEWEIIDKLIKDLVDEFGAQKTDSP